MKLSLNIWTTRKNLYTEYSRPNFDIFITRWQIQYWAMLYQQKILSEFHITFDSNQQSLYIMSPTTTTFKQIIPTTTSGTDMISCLNSTVFLPQGLTIYSATYCENWKIYAAKLRENSMGCSFPVFFCSTMLGHTFQTSCKTSSHYSPW